jgi:hypothetical protein
MLNAEITAAKKQQTQNLLMFVIRKMQLQRMLLLHPYAAIKCKLVAFCLVWLTMFVAFAAYEHDFIISASDIEECKYDSTLWVQLWTPYSDSLSVKDYSLASRQVIVEENFGNIETQCEWCASEIPPGEYYIRYVTLSKTILTFII